MDATQYVTTQAGTGVAVRLPDGFCFKKGGEVWRVLCPDEWPYREYVLDFTEVTTISDCGIAWLRFFLGWAQATQVEVRLSGMSEALAARLIEAERKSEAGSARPEQREVPAARPMEAERNLEAGSPRVDHHEVPAARPMEAERKLEAGSPRVDHHEVPADVPSVPREPATPRELAAILPVQGENGFHRSL